MEDFEEIIESVNEYIEENNLLDEGFFQSREERIKSHQQKMFKKYGDIANRYNENKIKDYNNSVNKQNAMASKYNMNNPKYNQKYQDIANKFNERQQKKFDKETAKQSKVAQKAAQDQQKLDTIASEKENKATQERFAFVKKTYSDIGALLKAKRFEEVLDKIKDASKTARALIGQGNINEAEELFEEILIEGVFDFLKKKREERERADINSTNTPNGNLSAQIANAYKTLGDAINNFENAIKTNSQYKNAVARTITQQLILLRQAVSRLVVERNNVRTVAQQSGAVVKESVFNY